VAGLTRAFEELRTGGDWRIFLGYNPPMKNRLHPAIGLKRACESYSDVIVPRCRGEIMGVPFGAPIIAKKILRGRAITH
jgi:hypothetical protein